MGAIIHYILLSVFICSQAVSANEESFSRLSKKSWGLASHVYINSDSFQVNPVRSLANYAMPSGSSTYFVTILEKNTQYSISGKLTQDHNIVFSSLTMYDKRGNIVTMNGDKQTWNMKNKSEFKKFEFKTNNEMNFLIQRFYRNHSNNNLQIFLFKK